MRSSTNKPLSKVNTSPNTIDNELINNPYDTTYNSIADDESDYYDYSHFDYVNEAMNASFLETVKEVGDEYYYTDPNVHINTDSNGNEMLEEDVNENNENDEHGSVDSVDGLFDSGWTFSYNSQWGKLTKNGIELYRGLFGVLRSKNRCVGVNFTF